MVLQNFSGEQMSYPITYLGLSLTLKRLKPVHLQPVLDRAASKLSGWQGRLINLGGRRELVKSILSSLPTYLLTALKAPKQFYKAMDKIRRRFLWAGNEQLHGGECKVSWAQVCQPLNRGGLGIMDLERFGHALRLRWLWLQWTEPNKPWHNTELPVDDVDKDLFAAAMRVQVHNGKTAKFWTDSWLNGAAPAAMFPMLYQHSKKKNRTVAEALGDDHWIGDLMHNLTTPTMIEYSLLWELVNTAHFDQLDQGEDTIIWIRSKDDKYSAKSAYSI
jgi:hypothetical protein